MARIVFHGPHFGFHAERIGDALGRAFVIGGKADTHVAVVEDRIVRPIGLFDLIERLRD